MRTIIEAQGISTVVAEAMSSKLAEAGVENVLDTAVLTDGDLKSVLNVEGANLVSIKKVIAAFKSEVASTAEAAGAVALPTMPASMTSSMDIVTTGNVEANMGAIVKYINVINLYNLDIEDIAANLIAQVEHRFAQQDLPATDGQLEIYKTVNKFKADDSEIYKKVIEKFDMKAALVDSRESVIDMGNEMFIPAIVEFVNDALDFRLQVANIDEVVIRRVLNVSSPGTNVNVEDVRMATNNFIMSVNTGIAGLNTLVINETYKLYIELYELLSNDDLHTFLGCSNKEELLKLCGVSISPKQARVFTELPESIYALVEAGKGTNANLNDKEYLYKYLSKAWEAMKTLDLMAVAPAEAREAMYGNQANKQGVL